MSSERRTVLFVAPLPPPVHGAAYAMQYLLEGAAAEQFRILHVDSRFADDVSGLQKVSGEKLRRLVRYCGSIIGHCRRESVDGVVLTPTFYFKPFLKDAVFIWLCVILRRRITAWMHMDFRAMRYDALPAWARWFVRTTLRRCDRVVVPADRLLSFMPDWLPRERLAAIPNGLPAGPLPPRQSDAGRRLRVLYLSNIEDNKGWRTFVDAARRLGHACPEVEFILHGAPLFGTTPEIIAEEIARDPLDGRLRWEGPVFGEAKWGALADADLFCFPSWHEAFPLSILEAMCAGLPIVATDVGGVPDAVTDGEGGRIVPPRDAAALAEALQPLLTDAGLRASMGRANRARWERDYTVEAYRLRWCRFLEAWLATA